MSANVGVRRLRVVVSGKVQGVFFRVTCARRARELDVAGWVGNAPAGSVEGVFEGQGEAVEAMLAWCHRGPPGAEVTHVEAVEEAPTGESGFRIVGR